MKKRYYTVKEVAEHFAVSTKTVYRLIRNGEFRAVKVRSSLRISADIIHLYEEKLKKSNEI